MDPKLWVPKETVMNPDLEQRLAEKKHRLEVYDKVAYLFER